MIDYQVQFDKSVKRKNGALQVNAEHHFNQERFGCPYRLIMRLALIPSLVVIRRM